MISIQNAVLRNPVFRFREPVSLTIEAGEHLAVTGPNGSGKSVLAQLITASYPLKEGKIIYDFYPSPVYENIKLIAFKDSYGPADSSYYLQQRWNSQDRDASPLVRDALGYVKNNSLRKQLFELFGIDEMIDKQMVLLSSGEMRKFQLTKVLLTEPRLLIIDNPFIGLDIFARKQLCDLLSNLTGAGAVQIILLLAKTDEIPGFITHIVPVCDMCCGKKVSRDNFKNEIPDVPVIRELIPPGVADNQVGCHVKDYSGKEECSCHAHVGDTGGTIIAMRDVSVRYGSRTILKSLNWTVKRGEKWALLGQNGSGKSTLLSLVCADNPQSYACDISLFGRRRGSGESIWDIKKRIGYVSPEMHRAYSENIPAIDIVASGLHDSMGLYVRPKSEQFFICEWWMNVFGIMALRDRNFLQMSDGEQRLVLLARAFVKDPELLVLDEPMHGLDTVNRLLVRSVIEAFCRRDNKTLIMVTHYERELPGAITHRLVI
ncbi:MAG TPA: molybdenum ABC transporter ATP-binding protein [Porphyromonadaceae bacterium]|nr:molybdenum ABC transporter ATP-binding protein [Porphyromonadaceae bacterium]